MSVKQRAGYYEKFMAAAQERRTEAMKLHRAGKTYAQIGAVFGVSKQRAFDMVQRAKLEAEVVDGR